MEELASANVTVTVEMSELNLNKYSKKVNIKKLKEEIDEIHNLFKMKKLGPENISNLIMEIVFKIQRLKKLNDIERRSIAICILNYLIEELIPGRDAPMESILKILVPDLVDQLMNFNIKKIVAKCGCFGGK